MNKLKIFSHFKFLRIKNLHKFFTISTFYTLITKKGEKNEVKYK